MRDKSRKDLKNLSNEFNRIYFGIYQNLFFKNKNTEEKMKYLCFMYIYEKIYNKSDIYAVFNLKDTQNRIENWDTSSDLAPYLTPLTFNEDVRSLCDQISDNIIMGNDKRYMIYSKLKSSDLSSDIELREAMGEFMVQWIHLEELVSKLTVNQNIRTRSPFSVNNLKRIFPDSELKKVLELRRYRNLMVHGVEFPPVDQIKYMTNEVERVCKYLENKKKM